VVELPALLCSGVGQPLGSVVDGLQSGISVWVLYRQLAQRRSPVRLTKAALLSSALLPCCSGLPDTGQPEPETAVEEALGRVLKHRELQLAPALAPALAI
jgi:hypothetical protein